MNDPLIKLKPERSSAEDHCNCAAPYEGYLAHKLVANPLHCLHCDGEIPLKNLQLSGPVIDALASWNSVFGALYSLWLDSGEYESWAKAQLLNAKGQVNVQGIAVCRSLNCLSVAYYLWFYEEPANRPASCPICKQEFVATHWRRRLACHTCAVVV
jgi:hypothetical protein